VIIKQFKPFFKHLQTEKYEILNTTIHLPVSRSVLFLLWPNFLKFYRERIGIFNGIGKSERSTPAQDKGGKKRDFMAQLI